MRCSLDYIFFGFVTCNRADEERYIFGFLFLSDIFVNKDIFDNAHHESIRITVIVDLLCFYNCNVLIYEVSYSIQENIQGGVVVALLSFTMRNYYRYL